MPDLPWTAHTELEPGRSYVVMASHLPLEKFSATLRFFHAVFAIRKQLATSAGLIGYTLRAKPIRRDYWTLSVWSDQQALRAFMRTAPHAQLMSSLKPIMGTTKFVQWEIGASDGRPDWESALEHLAAGDG